MPTKCNVLIFGASYGSLMGVKLALAGHDVKLVCLAEEAEAINKRGARVLVPVKGREGLTEIDSRRLPGRLTAAGPAEVVPSDYELVALAMQEPQYGAKGVRELLRAVARAHVPCLSIMNMPPLPYMARVPGIRVGELRDCYTDASVWNDFDSACMTLCSPDPQAFRPQGHGFNVLQVRLPTNFKAARFPSDAHTEILRRLEADIEAARLEGTAVPVKLRVHDSVFVPLAKWAMLMAGNYRCITRVGIQPIRDTVHNDLTTSRDVYTWVVKVCISLGANQSDLVPFEKYASAAAYLASPSSAARALYSGAVNIERVDRLVQSVAAQKGMRHPVIDEVVALVDAQLAANRVRSESTVAAGR